jgi:predicted nucleic acid-binding protein
MFDELIVANDHDYHNKAMEYMNLYYPERITFFDCVYMALMEDLGIEEIATFDTHFDLNNNIKRIF